MKQLVLTRFEEYDKEFIFGVSGKMMSFMVPDVFFQSNIQETDSLLIDQFVDLLKKGGRGESEILAILENFHKNSSILKEWELETLKQQRQDRLQIDLGIKKGQDQDKISLIGNIKALERKRGNYDFYLPFAYLPPS